MAPYTRRRSPTEPAAATRWTTSALWRRTTRCATPGRRRLRRYDTCATGRVVQGGRVGRPLSRAAPPSKRRPCSPYGPAAPTSPPAARRPPGAAVERRRRRAAWPHADNAYTAAERARTLAWLCAGSACTRGCSKVSISRRREPPLPLLHGRRVRTPMYGGERLGWRQTVNRCCGRGALRDAACRIIGGRSPGRRRRQRPRRSRRPRGGTSTTTAAAAAATASHRPGACCAKRGRAVTTSTRHRCRAWHACRRRVSPRTAPPTVAPTSSRADASFQLSAAQPRAPAWPDAPLDVLVALQAARATTPARAKGALAGRPAESLPAN